MDEDKFWGIIEQSRQGTDDSQAAQEENLRAVMNRLDVHEVVAFDRVFNEMRFRAYTWDLWGAAYIINGGCSDDGFEYFRCALIAAGRERYDEALRDPESLAGWVEGGDFEFEAFWYVAPSVYCEKSGTNKFPQHNLIFPKSPSGEAWEEDDLEARFPKLWAAFGA
jgi:hypothetical protein